MALFFSRTYDEAYTLLVEARDYLAYREPIDRRALAVDARLSANCEAMRLTSRLTQVMAWLLLQKAVHAGEVTAGEAVKDENRLAGQTVCLNEEADRERLPPRLLSLLDRSYRLYRRVERLDGMVAEAAQGLRCEAGTLQDAEAGAARLP